MPARSPVAEWHDAQLAAKYSRPAAASPTTMFSSSSAPGGGPPWGVARARTLCMYAATARASASESDCGGIEEPPGVDCPSRSTGQISSPARSRSTSRERSRFGPPRSPPRRSIPWQPRQWMPYSAWPRAISSGSPGGRCCASNGACRRCAGAAASPAPPPTVPPPAASGWAPHAARATATRAAPAIVRRGRARRRHTFPTLLMIPAALRADARCRRAARARARPGARRRRHRPRCRSARTGRRR